MGQERFAQFGNEVLVGVIGEGLEGVLVSLEGGGDMAGSVQFQAKVHEEIGVAGDFLDGSSQQAEVSLVFATLADQLGGVAVMAEDGVAEVGFQAPFLGANEDGREDLFMDAGDVEEAGGVSEETGDVGIAIGFGADVHQGQAGAEDAVLGQGGTKAVVLIGGKFLVGIQAEDPIAAGMEEGGIAGGGEVIAPGEGMNFGTEGAGDLEGAIGGAGIDHHDLVGERADGIEATSEELFFVLNDQADGKARRRGGLGRFLGLGGEGRGEGHPIRGGALGFVGEFLEELTDGFPVGGKGARVLGAASGGGDIAGGAGDFGEQEERFGVKGALFEGGEGGGPGLAIPALIEGAAGGSEMAEAGAIGELQGGERRFGRGNGSGGGGGRGSGGRGDGSPDARHGGVVGLGQGRQG